MNSALYRLLALDAKMLLHNMSGSRDWHTDSATGWCKDRGSVGWYGFGSSRLCYHNQVGPKKSGPVVSRQLAGSKHGKWGVKSGPRAQSSSTVI